MRAVSFVMRMAIVTLVLLTGCPDRTVATLAPDQNGQVTKKISTSTDVDILLVIDNSSSTSDKQTVFAQNFVNFVTALDQFPGNVRPNLHIGVVSTTVGLRSDAFATNGCPRTGDDGLLQNKARVIGCVAPSDRYLSDVADGNGGRRTNYSGTLDQALSCIAQLGSGGCGFEAPLEAMKLALDGSQAANAGFLRANAYLAVVILTDEDDCSVRDSSLFDRTDLSADDFRCQPLYAYTCDRAISATGPGSYSNCHARTDSYLQDTARYNEALAAIKDPSQIIVAVIAGDPKADIKVDALTLNGKTQPLALQPSCAATINGNPAIARPAIRLGEFLARFGDRGLLSTVCQSDYSGVVANISKLIADAISPCLDGAIDLTGVDPQNPTPQLQCTVSDVAGSEVLIPRCAMTDPTTPAPGPRPCWWVKSNPIACAGTVTHLELHVDQPPPTATFQINCAVTPTQ